jgi:hypothetical protein
MYGLPDSAIYGTYRRIRGTVKRRGRIETDESSVAWLWGWVGMAGVYAVVYVFLTLTGGL